MFQRLSTFYNWFYIPFLIVLVLAAHFVAGYSLKDSYLELRYPGYFVWDREELPHERNGLSDYYFFTTGKYNTFTFVDHGYSKLLSFVFPSNKLNLKEYKVIQIETEMADFMTKDQYHRFQPVIGLNRTELPQGKYIAAGLFWSFVAFCLSLCLQVIWRIRKAFILRWWPSMDAFEDAKLAKKRAINRESKKSARDYIDGLRGLKISTGTGDKVSISDFYFGEVIDHRELFGLKCDLDGAYAFSKVGCFVGGVLFICLAMVPFAAYVVAGLSLVWILISFLISIERDRSNSKGVIVSYHDVGTNQARHFKLRRQYEEPPGFLFWENAIVVVHRRNRSNFAICSVPTIAEWPVPRIPTILGRAFDFSNVPSEFLNFPDGLYRKWIASCERLRTERDLNRSATARKNLEFSNTEDQYRQKCANGDYPFTNICFGRAQIVHSPNGHWVITLYVRSIEDNEILTQIQLLQSDLPALEYNDLVSVFVGESAPNIGQTRIVAIGVLHHATGQCFMDTREAYPQPYRARKEIWNEAVKSKSPRFIQQAKRQFERYRQGGTGGGIYGD